MASRIAEVIYKLRDAFTGPARKIDQSYDKIRKSSRQTANAVEADNSRISKSFGLIAGAAKRAIAPLIAFAAVVKGARATGKLADDLDRLGKTAAKLQIDVGQLAGLEFAAERSGVEVGKVEASLFTLQKRSGEAEQGIGAAKAAFEQLKISAAEFNQLDTVSQVELLADRLSLIESATDRANISSAIFGKGNAGDFIKLLNQGGEAIRGLVREQNSLREVTDESTAIAAEFNDSLTNLGAGFKGLVDRALTPAIAAWVKFSRAVGLTEATLEEQLANAQANLAELEAKRGRAGRAAAGGIQRQRAEIARLTRAIDEQNDKQAELAKRTAETTKAREAAERIEEEYRKGLEATTDALEDQTRIYKTELDKQTRELRQARADQQSIDEEFAELREEVTSPDSENISGLDVQLKALEARRQLEAGDADAAIKSAREGADLLRDLKAEGDEAGFVLGFLADQLGNVAKEAAATKADAEVLDVAREAEKFNVLTEKLNTLKGDAAQQGTEIGKAIVASIQAELDAASLQLPDVVQQGITDYRRTIEKQGGPR